MVVRVGCRVLYAVVSRELMPVLLYLGGRGMSLRGRGRLLAIFRSVEHLINVHPGHVPLEKPFNPLDWI